MASHPIPKFEPKYKQPFSLEMAMELDVQTLTTELARLADSVQRLEETQQTLSEALVAMEHGNESNTVDPDLALAFKENVETIGSQKERMEMITISLAQKGVSQQSIAHYAPGLASYLRAPKSQDPSATSTSVPSESGGIDL